MSPRSAATVSVVLAARICSRKPSLPGSVGVVSQVTLSCWAARTASHSLAATTPMKSRFRMTRAPGIFRMELSSTAIAFAAAP